ncbi:MAG: carboxypeptidase-like regulatory domain-containing protein, partial [Ginsengibacter sp.]
MEVKSKFSIVRQIYQLIICQQDVTESKKEIGKVNLLWHRIAFTGLSLLLCLGAFAQSTITGTVKNSENGEPITGASVFIKGTNTGTTANSKGVFSMQYSGNQTLIVSAVGFNNKEVKIGPQQQLLNIVLTGKTEDLEEVVVTALGIKRQEKSLGYSTQTVTNEQLTEAMPNNWTDALAGKVAGLDMVKSNGGPDGSNKIILRGENNLTGDNEALIVVDGVVTNQ